MKQKLIPKKYIKDSFRILPNTPEVKTALEKAMRQQASASFVTSVNLALLALRDVPQGIPKQR